MTKDYARIAADYAKAVTKGRISACRYVTLACQRHLDGLKAQKSKDYPYRFEPSDAHFFCRFAEHLPHVSGRWAARSNRLIELEPWQIFLWCSVFGWKRKSDGLRRYSYVYLEVPRKNSKSTQAAIVGLYMLAADNEYGAQIYSGATTEVQAHEVFRPAKRMAESKEGERLRRDTGLEVTAKRLVVSETNSWFTTMIGTPGEGQSPHCAIIDEFHEHPSSEQFDAMDTGMGAREQPLMVIITTAGDDVGGPCYDMHKRVVEVLEGSSQDDRLFGLIYTIDKDDDPADFECWRKANPNYGVSVLPDRLKGYYDAYLNQPARQNVLRSRHLNVWGGARAAWMDMVRWNQCAAPELTLDDFAGAQGIVALDLATKVDVASRIVLFCETEAGVEHYYVFHHGYVPEARVLDPRFARYAGWVAEGWLTATEGEEIDLRRILGDQLELARTVTVREFVFDPYKAAVMVAHELQDERFEVVQVGATVKNLSMPMKEVYEAVMADRLRHCGDPVLAWMVNNVTARVDAKDNVFPRKEKAENKIDGAVALIMAMARATALKLGEGVVRKSVYEERGFRML